MSEQNYLEMQKRHYDETANKWSLQNKNPVVGSYHEHNNWSDYDTYLFKNCGTKELVALDYGTGPGRNIIKFNDRFARIYGVDIGQVNIDKASINLKDAGITNSNLYVCDGKSIPVERESYDVVFSVICLQHICCHSIRYQIFKDVYRVLAIGGKFCFQMGYGGRADESRVYKFIPKEKLKVAGYFDNITTATGTNGMYDVSIMDEKNLEKDLLEIGFKDFLFDIRPTGPGDSHKNWIFVQVTK